MPPQNNIILRKRTTPKRVTLPGGRIFFLNMKESKEQIYLRTYTLEGIELSAQEGKGEEDNVVME